MNMTSQAMTNTDVTTPSVTWY